MITNMLSIFDTDHEVSEAINRSGRNLFYAVPVESDLAAVANILLTKDVHRVAVVGSLAAMNIVGVITLTSIVRYVQANAACLGSLSSCSIGTLFRMGEDVVFSLPETASTRLCFQVRVSWSRYLVSLWV